MDEKMFSSGNLPLHSLNRKRKFHPFPIKPISIGMALENSKLAPKKK